MLFEFLEQHGIDYQRFDHPAIFTCEQAKELAIDIPGTDLKNLFLCDERGKRHFLVAVSPEKRVALKALGAALNVSGLRFASAERLKKFLNLEPGSVTLLAAINDPDKQVEVFIDREVWDSEAFRCHPLVNTSTLVITRQALEKFFATIGHSIRVIVVPAQA